MSKNQPFPNSRSRSDEFRGLGKGPADPAKSPIPAHAESPIPRPAAHAQSPPACTAERPSRREPARPNHLRGRVAAITVTVCLGLLLAAAPQALAANQTLKVNVTGSGSVSANEGAISGCQESAGTCEGEYTEGATITLIASPVLPHKFLSWTGCNAVTGDECQVKVTAAISVKAEFTAPKATTGEATAITHTSATLNGKVNPDGVELKATEGCFFEYGKTEAYGEKAACEKSAAQIGSGTSPVSVEAKITGLVPSPEYHYRLVTANATPETKTGSDKTFSTVHAFSTSFGTATSTPADPVPLTNPTDVAVDQSNGDGLRRQPRRQRAPEGCRQRHRRHLHPHLQGPDHRTDRL